jgi:sec-independent protein translocase protein TatA
MPLGLHLPELLILLAVALLIFGPKKLPEMGSAIGKSITSFRKGMKDANQKLEEEDQGQLDQKRTELEALERELASKKAALNQEETAQAAEQKRQ